MARTTVSPTSTFRTGADYLSVGRCRYCNCGPAGSAKRATVNTRLVTVSIVDLNLD
jgi:hypothetical protein